MNEWGEVHIHFDRPRRSFSHSLIDLTDSGVCYGFDIHFPHGKLPFLSLPLGSFTLAFALEWTLGAGAFLFELN